MGWLKYGDSRTPTHNCDLPKREHMGDIWQCDDCLKTYRVEFCAPYGLASWCLIAFSDALKDVAMLHNRNNGQ